MNGVQRGLHITSRERQRPECDLIFAATVSEEEKE